MDPSLIKLNNTFRAQAFGLSVYDFLECKYDLKNINNFYFQFTPDKLKRVSEKRTVALFKQVAEHVPAYKNFLRFPLILIERS